MCPCRGNSQNPPILNENCARHEIDQMVVLTLLLAIENIFMFKTNVNQSNKYRQFSSPWFSVTLGSPSSKRLLNRH